MEIKTICARELVNADYLARICGARAVCELTDLMPADLTIVAVADDAIEEIGKELPSELACVHTSGSVSVDVFSGREKAGILYPLQTFSKDRQVNMREVPFFVESENLGFREELEEFCIKHLSSQVFELNSERRKHLHLAAVFTSNFTIQIIREAERLIEEAGLDMTVLHPLLRESLSKAIAIGGDKALTGPAKRRDEEVLLNHQQMLKDEDLRRIYELISERIKSTT